jgi:uncharacterized membrane-anchored protein
VRKFVIVAAVAAQLVVLGWMAGEREWVVRTGRIVYLRTAPVDPQDPMRGDYVRLNYEIATVPKRLCREGVAAWFNAKEEIYNANVRDRRVYAEIRLDPEGLAELISLSDRAPTQGLYLRGRADVLQLSTVQVRFGVEAFFMQQGKAKAFEDTMRNEKAGVPLNSEVAVSASGLAVLKGYRWEPLGITLVLDRNPAANSDGSNRRPGLRGLTVELKNHGSTPQAIVDGPTGHTLRLVQAEERWRTGDQGDQTGWEWVGETAVLEKPLAANVKVLQPGESYRAHIDLTAAEWLVRKMDGKNGLGPATAIESLANDWTASFRIEYAPPRAEECAGLPQAELIRHSKLRSRRFGAGAGVD